MKDSGFKWMQYKIFFRAAWYPIDCTLLYFIFRIKIQNE